MDFIDAMKALNEGKKVSRRSFLNCHWENLSFSPYMAPEIRKEIQEEGWLEERSTGPAACAGSVKFKFENIRDEEKNATDWYIVE